MTNEDLCQRYQDGDQGALLELWQQNRGLVRLLGRRVARVLAEQGRSDVDIEDLEQQSWFALALAVRDYEPGSGCRFTTFYDKRLRTAFAEAAHYRTERQQRDPINRAGSLDAPISDTDPDSGCLGDLIPDTTDESEQVLDRLQEEWERAFLRSQVDALPADQAQVLRLRYWNRATRAAAAAAMGVNDAKVRELERRGLDALRRRREVRALRGYVDERTDFFRGGSNPVEANAIWREELTERWSGHRIE